MRTRWAAIGAAVAVSLGAGAVLVANAASYPTTGFTAITPCRLLDTRTDVAPVATSKIENKGIRQGLVQDKNQGNTSNNDIVVIFDPDARTVGDTFTLQYGTTDFRPIMGDCSAQFVDQGDFDLNQTVITENLVQPTALLLNVTTTGSTANSFVTVYPWKALGSSGTSTTGRPFFSNLNPVSSLPAVSNNVTVALSTITTTPLYLPSVKCASGTHGASGSNCAGHQAFRVYNESGNTHVIIDVLGYYTGTPS